SARRQGPSHEPADREESIMTAGKNRGRLALELLEDRCTPSAMWGGLAAPSLAHHGGPHAAVSSVGATHENAIPFKVAFHCSVDLNEVTVTSTGSATGGVGTFTWTALGHADHVDIALKAGRGVYSGTGTLVTATGDQMFYRFTTSWKLSTGKGTHFITVTGGT